jgi:hypothetical protein
VLFCIIQWLNSQKILLEPAKFRRSKSGFAI